MANRFPPWIVKRLSLAPSDKKGGEEEVNKTRNLLRRLDLHTVCEGARCPNLWECFAESIATFMILGNICTRNCKFCSVAKGTPLPVEQKEPKRIAQAVQKLGLRHVVITSVTRDDLPDGGASQFFFTVREVRSINSDIIIEVLIPDFAGNEEGIKQVLKAKPDIIAHNLETVPSLYGKVRPGASYERSLKLLDLVKMSKTDIYAKTGLMLGLGEEEQEILGVMEDLRKIDCDILTIGQYLQPSSSHLEVRRFIPPGKFEEYRQIAEKMGFLFVASGPFVRSSYRANEFSRRFIRNV
ncbi:MAG: lipoyl synthase [Elusimicrobiota bacterium]|nr:lipoyl synthase [Elusimicrobiota bacterium]MDH5661670.1 lipoyl synthase [Elusimicrobiota bacterium]